MRTISNLGLPLRRTLFLGLAVLAVAATSAVPRAQAQEAPCGDFTGNKCVEIEWCVGVFGNKVCSTKTLTNYRPGEEEREL